MEETKSGKSERPDPSVVMQGALHDRVQACTDIAGVVGGRVPGRPDAISDYTASKAEEWVSCYVGRPRPPYNGSGVNGKCIEFACRRLMPIQSQL